MSDEMVDVEVRLDKEIIDKLNKMTKKELINEICVAALGEKLATEKVKDVERFWKVEAAALQTKLDKAEAYVEQGRAMISAVMERWYEYDA